MVLYVIWIGNGIKQKDSRCIHRGESHKTKPLWISHPVMIPELGQTRISTNYNISDHVKLLGRFFLRLTVGEWMIMISKIDSTQTWFKQLFLFKKFKLILQEWFSVGYQSLTFKSLCQSAWQNRIIFKWHHYLSGCKNRIKNIIILLRIKSSQFSDFGIWEV